MPFSIPLGGLGLTLLSCGLTATVIGNAYYQKKQFYPSVVYITKSNPSMAAIYLMAFTLVILFGKLLKKIFFGTLRAAESEHLIERFFYAVTETCLAFTVFRDDFSPKFVALFTVLLFLKAFHWLADYRVDYMERSPIITRVFHIRVASLLILLSTIDILLVRHAYHSTMSLGASVQLVFGFEYAILLTVAYNIGVKYLCHGIDLNSENPWENKAMYLLYTELFVGFIKVLLYVVFLFIMVRIHTFPLFIIRPMYLTMKSFKKALQDILQSRRAIHNMNTQYPNASAEDLQDTDNVCIICREEMLLNTGVKKLPCNHLFHATCLRSWFQRQQTCPTCRLDVLRQTPNTPPRQQDPPPPPAAEPRRPPPTDVVELMQRVNEQMRNMQSGAVPGNAANATPTATGAIPNARAPLIPPMMMIPPPPVPPPPPPRDFGPLTLEELREMEGHERKHVVARLQVLNNINTLITAATIQLTQYNAMMLTLDATMPHRAAAQTTGVPPPTTTSQTGSSSGATSTTSAQPTTTTTQASTVTSTAAVTTATNETTVSADAASDSATSTTTSKTSQSAPATSTAPITTESEEVTAVAESSGGATRSEAGGPSGTAEEVRRRRLEHFAASHH